MFWQRQMLSACLVISLIIALAACSTGSTSPQAVKSPATPAHPTPTLTSLPHGTLLYQSDWSHGLAGWQVSAGWKLTHGWLQSDLSEGNFITLPYTPMVPNYALEVRFQIVSVPQNGGSFVITANRVRGKDGYTAGILGLLGPGTHSQFANPQVQVYLNPIDSMSSNMVVSDYEPGFGSHTYRIEVQDSQVRFFIDDLRKSFATGTQTNFLSNGPLQLKATKAIVRVFSVRISAL